MELSDNKLQDFEQFCRVFKLRGGGARKELSTLVNKDEYIAQSYEEGMWRLYRSY